MDSDTDTETPLQNDLKTTLSVTNNSHIHRHPPPSPPQIMVTFYKECLKNHAAILGGLALDGCGEFMPSPTATALNPTSLKCAACGCHRNFHRQDPYGAAAAAATTTTSILHLPLPIQWTSSPSHKSISPPPSGPSPTAAAVMMKEQKRNRARTKFSNEQKQRMTVFAEKLGWKMMRPNGEKKVKEFCSEIGVEKNVFKVWMHNNKRKRKRDRQMDNGNYGHTDICNDIRHGSAGESSSS